MKNTLPKDRGFEGFYTTPISTLPQLPLEPSPLSLRAGVERMFCELVTLLTL
jgi:hypothetical protein